MSDALPYSYQGYGLRIRSEIELPELTSACDPSTNESQVVTVQVRPLPPIAADARAEHGWYHATSRRLAFEFPHVGRFWIQEGSELLVDPYPEAEEAAVRLYILGVGMATILHQRGLLVLHAGGVSIDDRAVLFLGGKGHGKSTMVATMHRRGHPLITDDVAPVAMDRPGGARVFAAFPQLKLWPESAQALQLDPGLMERLYSGVDKRVHRPHGFVDRDELPINALFVLDYGPEVMVERLSGQEAFGHVMRHTFLHKMLRDMDSTQATFSRCVEFVRRIPVWRVQRPKDLSLVHSVAQVVEEHAALVEEVI